MKPLLVFQTDFTYAEGAVAAMYGVVKSVDRELEIMTATHQIPQYDTYSASYRLYQYMRYWPKGTIFVSVVDPGVGTSRRACVAKTKNGYYVVTPDNGTLSHIDKYFGLEELREIDESVNRLRNGDNEEVSIFHGRDLFGYCAAKLASGLISYEEVGPRYDSSLIVRHELQDETVVGNKICGIIEINDPNFGNLWSCIPKKAFEKFGFKHGDRIRTVIYYKEQVVFDDRLFYYESFGMAEDHTVMIYNNEVNKIALAEVIGNLEKSRKLGYGPDYRIEFIRE